MRNCVLVTIDDRELKAIQLAYGVLLLLVMGAAPEALDLQRLIDKVESRMAED
jgi:hypothetical protein